MKFCWFFFSFVIVMAMRGLAASVPPAKPDPFNDPLIKQIAERDRKAVAGDTEETKALASDLKKWTAVHPDDRLLQAYLGSVYTLCSRDAWPGPAKLNYLRDGDRLLNQAVEADPENPAVRFVRAIDFYELPAIFGKRQVARDDFKILLRQVNGESKKTYAFETETAQAIYYWAGLSLAEQGLGDQANEAWTKGLKLDDRTPIAAKIEMEQAKLHPSASL